MNHLLAATLASTSRPECQATALQLRSGSYSSLHLRSLNLSENELLKISSILNQHGNNSGLTSVSFSYNKLTGKGLKAILHAMPSTITELGLVGCTLQDTDGSQLGVWIEQAANLRMVCAEENHFSYEIKNKLRAIASQRSSLSLFL